MIRHRGFFPGCHGGCAVVVCVWALASFCFVWFVLFGFLVCVERYTYLTGGCVLPGAFCIELFIATCRPCAVATEIFSLSFCLFNFLSFQDRAFELNRPHSEEKNQAGFIAHVPG